MRTGRHIIKFSSVIYFLAHRDSNMVKIGYTRRRVEDRIKDIIPYSPVPLELVASADGGRDLEAWLHDHFSDLSLHHEWFRLEGVLKTLVDDLTVKGSTYCHDYYIANRTEPYVRFARRIPPDGRKSDGVQDAVHGTVSAYVSRNCRCDECKTAARAYREAYALRRAALASDPLLYKWLTLNVKKRGRPPKNR